jgi:hypothetical protein
MMRMPVLALLAALSLGPPAGAQETSAADALGRFAFQTHVFRRLLFDQGLRPLSSFGELGQDPANSVLIVLGNTSCLSRDNLPQRLTAFIEQGGAALIATDRATIGEARQMLVNAAGVEVVGKHFVGPDNEPEELYKNKAFCPLLVPIDDAQPDLFRGPRFDPTARLHVATNVPSCLKCIGKRPEGIDPLARLPRYSLPENLGYAILEYIRRHREPGKTTPEASQGNVVKDLTGEPYQDGPIFAVGGTWGQGRILVLADHSLFINQMMLPSDIGNLEFAYNCLEWLREGRQRRQVLLVEEGLIRTDIDVPVREVDLPPEVQAALVDRVLTHMDEQNTFNRMAWDWLMDRAGGKTSRLARWVLEILTVLIVIYAAYRIAIRSRHRVEPMVPLLAHAAARHAPAGPLLEQRYHALYQAGNLWETAHHLARGWFAEHWPTASSRPPSLALSGGWWHRWSLRRRFNRLWRLAHGTTATRVSPRRLRRVLADLDSLKAALVDGSLKIQEPAASHG